MTTKELLISLLDRVEQLESERASLIAHLNVIRYADGRQPDTKQIMADRTTLETVQARNAALRQSIVLANDDNFAISALLNGLTGLTNWEVAPLHKRVDLTFGPDDKVVLDSNHFVHCIFRNCTIQYFGGRHILDDCVLDGTILWEFYGGASITLALFRHLCDNEPETRSQLFPNWRQWTAFDATVH